MGPLLNGFGYKRMGLDEKKKKPVEPPPPTRPKQGWWWWGELSWGAFILQVTRLLPLKLPTRETMPVRTVVTTFSAFSMSYPHDDVLYNRSVNSKSLVVRPQRKKNQILQRIVWNFLLPMKCWRNLASGISFTKWRRWRRPRVKSWMSMRSVCGC